MLPEEVTNELFEEFLQDAEFAEALDELMPASLQYNFNNQLEIDKDSERLMRLTSVIGKFATTLTGRPIAVHIADNNVGDATYNTEAWSDAENIWFNKNMIKDLSDPEVVAAIKGLALHEVSHIMLTPRSGSNLVKWAKQNDYMRAFNALEDQRIETFMAAKFSSVGAWLTSAVAKYLLANPTTHSTAYVMTHGRRYLPADLRNMIQGAYSIQDDTAELADIIDNYTVLNLSDSAHIPVAMQLIERYHNLVSKLGQEKQQQEMEQHGYSRSGSGWKTVQDINGHQHRPENLLKSSEKSKPMNKAGQDKIVDKVLKQRQQENQNGSGTDEGEEYEKPEAPDGCGPEGGSGDKPDGDGEGEGQSGAGGADGDTPVERPRGAGTGGEATMDELTNLLQRTLNKSIQSIRQDVADTIKQLNGEVVLTGKSIPVPSRKHFRNEPVAPAVINASRSFTKELELIKADYDPGWNRKVEAGKLNVERYMMGKTDLDECFDEWDMGREDAIDIECVVVLDISGSMGWTINEAYDSMWAIKRGMDKVGASTTVVTFGSQAEILYNANELASHTKRYGGTGGGTEPEHAIKYARNIFADSNRAVKIMIVITDGMWWNAKETEDTIRILRSSGVVTALAYIDDRQHNVDQHPENEYVKEALTKPLTIDGHGCEVIHTVNTAADLFELSRKMVKVGIIRNLSS